MENIIYQKGKYRILEVLDNFYDLDDLKGDLYNPKANPDICPLGLKTQEKEFEIKVSMSGVFGYVLEGWDGEIDKGWTHIDSCFGFIGTHKKENHYIVEEFKELIKQKGL